MAGDEYRILRDQRDAPDRVPRVELPMGFEVLRAADVLEELFTTESRLDAVALVVGDEVVGGTSRDHVLVPVEEERSVGTGDGATLPGYSATYELLKFVCAECGRVTYRLQVDPRDEPRCVDGHGALELER
ncbi:hypothetical protein [Kribbella ginsengisoli]|uniref:Uncharacterized protein n=1 Tax=Kribbella ginsengisoli TaxID=363865 RepID=A0ABP6WI32_9ACTN